MAKVKTLSINGATYDFYVATDTQLSETSDNPVSNKVITAEINSIKDQIGMNTSSKEKEWVKKDTITESHTTATLDLTGCTEIALKGSATVTRDTHIEYYTKSSATLNAGYILYAAFTTTNSHIFAACRDTCFGFDIDSIKAGTSFPKNSSNIQRTSILNGTHISDITKIRLDAYTGTVSGREIEIWAR